MKSMRAYYMCNTFRFAIVIFAIIIGQLLIDNASAGDDTVIDSITIVLDPGHTHKSPGAVSISGSYEVDYNDRFVSLLSKRITKAGYHAVLTRDVNAEVSLDERSAITNNSHSKLFISIHHDSAQLQYLEQLITAGKKAYQTREPIAGYSIFVSKKNSEFEKSYSFATLLGEELLKLGRKPTLHHAEMIAGESRPLLNKVLGIYQYDDLLVLKKAEIPAILLEVGVIVDKQDESYVTNPENQNLMINAIIASINKFIKKDS